MPQAPQGSPYRRAEFDIQLAIPPTRSVCGMEGSMIEIVYKEENPDVEQSIKLPKNVKQIGGEPGKRRVYLEDYVVSCIKGNSST